ncbi:MAG: FtsH protease activity modulator HflK [Gammaproteobacteria bacterium]|uniref:FtsH protease activity modulator HflK n=1 Tax=Rhodoferax sp. TaxID=50421 RepID=UPI00185DAC77|nr:FtsH protease activity modulator HflK [Rhodoferax sp.]MBU3899572.1 FtsH protease activity modulator HflK [Gammaproteobacteria bacterium]MBA3059879.1 FtsH protease activity modulator HflK [Rhodoferax sp.]MBU4018048.1 FtsH protease activity modulator HflK [Gammaproteobacteria bacterium]MBU4080261.1 FtsH protease activity modulator HflK [Gammaproteobacteria bacterium]MBU4112683.1 FtsH protease activity modulator HflK [Gammaproteobacteria bacterium]
MKLHLHTNRRALWPERIRGMFNLNDPRWGRGDDRPTDAGEPEVEPERQDSKAPDTPPRNDNQRGQRRGPNQGPPDLDELWRDFNRKLGGLFGNVKNPIRGGAGGGMGGNGAGGGFQPDMKSAGIGVGLIIGVVLLIWLGTGFFIVQEGQQAVITQFGKYRSSVGAGFNWRLPYPIQRHELVFVTQIRSVDIGRDTIIKATGLRESAMLTQDENIVEIKFAVQYRLNDARAFLFESKDPTAAVVQAAETSVREVVGKMRMDSALAEERDQIAPRVRALMQKILDHYKVGIEVVGINLQQSGVRPPEQVQAAFDDVLKAGQERERAKNEAQAYANDVVPRAVGSASRLKEEADAYKARIVAQAQGDAQRFRSVLTEYQKAPQVTRDRMYVDTMQQIYSSVTKVMIDSRQGSNLLYLPLDKIVQMTGQVAEDAALTSPATASTNSAAIPTLDARARDAARARDRDTR